MRKNNKRTLDLKPVGMKTQSPASFKKKMSKIERTSNAFDQEEDPFEANLIDQKKLSKCIRKKKPFNLIEDPRRSIFSHRKLLVIEKLIFFIIVLAFFLSILHTEIKTTYYSGYKQICQLILNSISGSTFFLQILIILRYVCYFELLIDQKRVYIERNQDQKFQFSLIDFLTKSDQLFYCLLEMLIILPHPNNLLVSFSIQIYQPMHEQFVKHEVNNLLAIFMEVRMYMFVRSLVNMTIYSSSRASRVCQQNGVEHNFLYSIKCILNEEPLWTILIVFFVSLILLGNGIKLSEGVLTATSTLKNTGFTSYYNCIWCVFVTMGTIGYGDYVPVTIPGRIILIISAISGVVLSSLLIVSLSNYLTMQGSQFKSHLTLMRLCQQKKLSDQAARTLQQTIKVSKFLAQVPQQGNKSILLSLFTRLKKKIDFTKQKIRKLRSMTDTNNINQQMNRLFYMLNDSLKLVYNNQERIQKCLEICQGQPKQKLNTIKISFAKQVQYTIKNL